MSTLGSGTCQLRAQKNVNVEHKEMSMWAQENLNSRLEIILPLGLVICQPCMGSVNVNSWLRNNVNFGLRYMPILS
jgi:hypothetical protein